jgi:hypothetical protein
VTYANFLRVYVAMAIGLALLGIAQGRGKLAPYHGNGCAGGASQGISYPAAG